MEYKKENLISETWMPGKKVSPEDYRMVHLACYFVSQFVAGKQVLEVGCGPGFGLGYLAKKARRVIAGDCTEDSLRYAQGTYRGKEKIKLLLLDAHMLPFKDASFDVVIALGVVNYLHLDKFLVECRRVLKRGGTYIFSIPNKDRPGFHPSYFSNKYYSAHELFALLNYSFDAELFGVFPVPQEQARLVQQRIQTAVIALGARVLNLFKFMPIIEQFKELVKKLIGYKTFVLKRELADEDMRIVENIQIVPLDGNYPDFRHKILYVIARTR